MFYTDHWEAFSKVLPKDRHIVGKKHTHMIERDNSNTRHQLARMTRRTKVVSRSERMLDKSIKLWQSLNQPIVFEQFQRQLLAI